MRSASSSNLRSIGGEEKHALTEAEGPPHVHGISIYASFVAPTSGDGGISLGDAGVTRYTTSTGGGEPHNNMPPYATVLAHVRAG